MSKTLNKALTAIVPAEQMELFAQEYKARKLKRPDRRPNLPSVAEAVGINKIKLDLILGQVGDREALHRFLAQTVDIEQTQIENVLTLAVEEAKNRIKGKMADRDLIQLIKTLSEMVSPAQPKSSGPTNIQINNGPQNIDQLLAERRLNIVEAEDEG